MLIGVRLCYSYNSYWCDVSYPLILFHTCFCFLTCSHLAKVYLKIIGLIFRIILKYVCVHSVRHPSILCDFISLSSFQFCDILPHFIVPLFASWLSFHLPWYLTTFSIHFNNRNNDLVVHFANMIIIWNYSTIAFRMYSLLFWDSPLIPIHISPFQISMQKPHLARPIVKCFCLFPIVICLSSWHTHTHEILYIIL